MRNDANCEGPGTTRGSPDVHQTAPSRTLQNPSENQHSVLFGCHKLQGPLEKPPFSTTLVHESCALRRPHKSAPGCSQERNSRRSLQHFHRKTERNMARKHPLEPLHLPLWRPSLSRNSYPDCSQKPVYYNELKKRPQSTTRTRSNKGHQRYTNNASKMASKMTSVGVHFRPPFGSILGSILELILGDLYSRRMDTCTRKEPSLKTCFSKEREARLILYMLRNTYKKLPEGKSLASTNTYRVGSETPPSMFGTLLCFKQAPKQVEETP